MINPSSRYNEQALVGATNETVIVTLLPSAGLPDGIEEAGHGFSRCFDQIVWPSNILWIQGQRVRGRIVAVVGCCRSDRSSSPAKVETATDLKP